jgi:hypothetical protein
MAELTNLIKDRIDLFFYDIYNIRYDKKIDSSEFLLLFDNINYIVQQRNYTLNEFFSLFPIIVNNKTIIHIFIEKILYVEQLYFNNNHFITYSNRTDINYDDNFIPINHIKNDNYHNRVMNQCIKQNFDYTSQMTFFIFLLLLEGDNILLNTRPIELLNKDFYKTRIKNSKNILLFNSLVMVLSYGKNLVIIHQKYIRRYLARRYIIKIKKQKCFNIFLYSPPKQIELNFFEFFPGGYNIEWDQLEEKLQKKFKKNAKI